MVGVLLFCRFATRSFSNLHPGGAPESKEWEEAKLSGPGKHSQSAWSVFSLSMKGLFNRAQFPLTLVCIYCSVLYFWRKLADLWSTAYIFGGRGL